MEKLKNTKGEFMDCTTNCYLSPEDMKSSKEFGSIDTNGLATLISSGIPLVIIDARSGQWDDGKRISRAKALSYEATATETAEVIPNKQSLIVVYCSNVQCSASNKLAKHLTDLGYSNILKYEEGIQDWISSGQPIQETRS